jgi:hypothetical protein
MKHLLLILLLLMPLTAKADPPKVEKAILHLITVGLPKHRIKPWLGHPFLKDDTGLKELAAAISEAAEDHKIPEMLMVAIAYRESTFLNDKEGDIGERSSFQMINRVARRAKMLDPQCDLKTYKGAARCSAVWLAHWSRRSRCRNLEGAIMMYATGKSCTPRTPKQKWIVQDRLGIARELERLFR